MYTGPRIVTDSLCFVWDGSNIKSWDGVSSMHKDSISGNYGLKIGARPLTKTSEGTLFDSAYTGIQSCAVEFMNSDIVVPTGDEGSWFWVQKFIDEGSADHPLFGKETSNGWNGVNGFVMGTGWGTDGQRVGIGGVAYGVYDGNQAVTSIRPVINRWQTYLITYQRNSATGLKVYCNDINGLRLGYVSSTTDVAIGSNTNRLIIGSTNNRAGNWNGYLNCVYMWTRALSESEIYQMFKCFTKK
jgi:hypothetical protein